MAEPKRQQSAEDDAPRCYDDEPRWGFNPDANRHVLLNTPDGKPLVIGDATHFPLDSTPTRRDSSCACASSAR